MIQIKIRPHLIQTLQHLYHSNRAIDDVSLFFFTLRLINQFVYIYVSKTFTQTPMPHAHHRRSVRPTHTRTQIHRKPKKGNYRISSALAGARADFSIENKMYLRLN